MAMFKVLWASTNLNPLTSHQMKAEKLSFHFYTHPKTCNFPNLTIYCGSEEGRLVFNLCIVSQEENKNKLLLIFATFLVIFITLPPLISRYNFPVWDFKLHRLVNWQYL